MFPSLITGFTTSMGLIAAIGAQNAFVLKQGLRREHIAAVALTCAASDALLMSAGIAGLGAAIQSAPKVITGIRWAGAVFLVAYGFLAARRAIRPGALKPAERGPATLTATLLTCLAFTYLNPHVYIDSVLLIGTIANQQTHHWLFGAGAVTASVIWFFGLGFGAQKLAPYLARPLTWRIVDGSVAIVMFAVAISLVR